jgi:hypothetical protein
MSDNGTLLSVENLSTHFFTEEGVVKAVQDVGFSWLKPLGHGRGSVVYRSLYSPSAAPSALLRASDNSGRRL